MADLTKCSCCKCYKLEAFFDVKATTGRRFKTCNTCRNRFKCTQCDAVHSTKGNLANHIKQVHSNIRDHACTQCPYSCSTKSHLTAHVKQVHDKIKDHACTQCPYSCSRKSNLAKHVKTCTGTLNVSGGELAVRKALELLGFEYETEVSEVPNGGKRLLRWDFKIDLFGCPAYIEYDGKQHFTPQRFGGMSMEKAQKALVECRRRDTLKNIWAADNSYALLRIPYMAFENILELVRTFVSI